MNSYIRGRLRVDAQHLVALSKNENLVQHPGLRGRLRELLIDHLLTPWLPPDARCGTGTVVDMQDRARESTQDDVIVFDRSIVPSVLALTGAQEGVFPLN